MMFDFPNSYLNIFKVQHFKFKSKATVLHQKTCPLCDRKLVNLYYSSQHEKYICKNCSEKLAE